MIKHAISILGKVLDDYDTIKPIQTEINMRTIQLLESSYLLTQEDQIPQSIEKISFDGFVADYFITRYPLILDNIKGFNFLNSLVIHESLHTVLLELTISPHIVIPTKLVCNLGEEQYFLYLFTEILDLINWNTTGSRTAKRGHRTPGQSLYSENIVFHNPENLKSYFNIVKLNRSYKTRTWIEPFSFTSDCHDFDLIYFGLNTNLKYDQVTFLISEGLFNHLEQKFTEDSLSEKVKLKLQDAIPGLRPGNPIA